MILQNLTLQHNTGYKAFDLQKSIFIIHELQLSIRCLEQKAIREKYKDPKVHPLSQFFFRQKAVGPALLKKRGVLGLPVYNEVRNQWHTGQQERKITDMPSMPQHPQTPSTLKTSSKTSQFFCCYA
jgi:hypothetical protein